MQITKIARTKRTMGRSNPKVIDEQWMGSKEGTCRQSSGTPKRTPSRTKARQRTRGKRGSRQDMEALE